MAPDEMIGSALATAEAGLAVGELPIGAVVFVGDQRVGAAYTQDQGRSRRLVHAELQATIQADEDLGWDRGPHPLRLAVTLKPCLMCLGAAMILGVSEVFYALDSPGDGAAGIAATWQARPQMRWYAAPAMTGGVRRDEARGLFRRYCQIAPDSGFRRWARTLADPCDESAG